MGETTGLKVSELRRLYREVDNRNILLPTTHFNQWVLKTINPDLEVYTTKPQNSDFRGSEAHQRVLCTIQHLSPKDTAQGQSHALCPMFVLSGVHFENVLKGKISHTERRKGKGTRSGTVNGIKGEADILIINKQGLKIIEIKSVGNAYEGQDRKNLTEVLDKLSEPCNGSSSGCETKASGTKTDAAELFACRLLETLQLQVPVMYVVALPNVPRSELELAAKNCPKFIQMITSFCRGYNILSPEQALRTRCLCKEEFSPRFLYQDSFQQQISSLKLSQWLQQLEDNEGRNEVMNDEHYLKLVAAFVSPLTHINVWSPKHKEMMSDGRRMRTPDDAIYEVGCRFQKAVLHSDLKRLFEDHKIDRCVFLWGPPASGKTLLLTVKAAQWLREGRLPIIVITDTGNPVEQLAAREMKQRILTIAKRRSGYVFIVSNIETDVIEIVKKIQDDTKNDKVGFLLNGIHDDESRKLAKCLRSSFHESPVWATGTLPQEKPKDFGSHKLGTVVRCPPAIQQILKDSELVFGEENDTRNIRTIPVLTREEQELMVSYSVSHGNRYLTCSTESCENFLPSDGPPVEWFSHHGHPADVKDCYTCGARFGVYLMEDLHVGSEGCRIRFGDVIIMTHGEILKSCKFLKGAESKGVKFTVVMRNNKKSGDLPENRILVTEQSLAWRLERRVVVFLPDGRPHSANSDTTAQPTTEYQRRLRALGKDNCRALRHALSCSVSHAVICHFGHDDKDNTGEGDSSDLRDNDEDAVDDTGDLADNPHEVRADENPNNYWWCSILHSFRCNIL